MNQDIFSGQWKQMRGTLKSWWGKLADDDLERIGGQTDKLIGWVQEKYGQTREQARQEVERRMKEYSDSKGGQSGNGTTNATETVAGMAVAKAQELGAAAVSAASGAATATTETVAGMAAKAQELGAAAVSTATGAATAVGEQIGSLAGAIRDRAPQEGAMATAATAVAGGLESASSYLKEKDYENLAADLTALVRNYPVHALVVGVGLGYLLARGMKG